MESGITGAFPSGQLLMTRSVNDTIADNEAFAGFVIACIKRHMTGDWGDVDAEDKGSNDDALLYGARLVSSYKLDRMFHDLTGETKLWIITEADRSSTLILWPSEY